MTTKKPATLLALAGTAALVVAGPAALASPQTPADTRPDAGATASSTGKNALMMEGDSGDD